MRHINRVWLGLGASVAVVGVVAGVTLGITTLLGVTFEESEAKPAEGVQTGIEASRYPGFSFCIQAIGIDPSVEAIAKARMETALLQVTQHRYWKLTKRDSPPPLVDIGCPSGPLVARPGVKWLAAQLFQGDPHQYDVVEPSFYWTFIFVMPIDQINQLLDGLSVRIVPQEYVRAGDQEHLETTAIYLSPEELEDPSFVVKQLMIAVGLESAYPEPTGPQPTRPGRTSQQ